MCGNPYTKRPLDEDTNYSELIPGLVGDFYFYVAGKER
jgi:hypothetical protein